MTAAKTPSLIEKLVEVATAIRNIEKGGRNEAQKYDYVSEADVVRKVWPELLSRGILFYPVFRKVQSIVEFKTAKGGDAFMTTVESMWEATDGGDLKIQVASLGQGADFGGDKGVYKALTGDKKYAVLQLLGIATGDDPEQGTRSDESEPSSTQDSTPFGLPSGTSDAGLTDDQRGLLFAKAREAGIDATSTEGSKQLGQFIFEQTNKRSVKSLDNADLDKILAGLAEMAAVVAATDGGTVSTPA